MRTRMAGGFFKLLAVENIILQSWRDWLKLGCWRLRLLDLLGPCGRSLSLGELH